MMMMIVDNIIMCFKQFDTDIVFFVSPYISTEQLEKVLIACLVWICQRETSRQWEIVRRSMYDFTHLHEADIYRLQCKINFPAYWPSCTSCCRCCYKQSIRCSIVRIPSDNCTRMVALVHFHCSGSSLNVALPLFGGIFCPSTHFWYSESRRAIFIFLCGHFGCIKIHHILKTIPSYK